MAKLKQVRTPEEIKKIGVANVRKEYVELANLYEKMVDRELLLCPCCGEWYKADTGFYYDKNYITDRYPICKRCLMKLVEQRKNDNEEPHETKESVQKVLRMMDRVYDDAFYEDCIKGAYDEVKERNRNSPFATYMTSIQSLPQYKGKTWQHSDFGAEPNPDAQEFSTRKPRKEIKKIFGDGFSDSQYLYLQDQYDDWCTRTQVDSKSQETYIIRICFKLLEIWEAQKAGKDTSKMDESLNKLMDAAKLQPKQNVSNAATDSLTFGQLIERWENERPIPQVEPDLDDVSGIGKNLRVWFGGWLAHALGLNIPASKEYEEEIAKYTVTKPDEQEQGTSSALYNKLFGTEGE